MALPTVTGIAVSLHEHENKLNLYLPTSYNLEICMYPSLQFLA